MLVELEGHGREDLFDRLRHLPHGRLVHHAFPGASGWRIAGPASLIKAVKEELRAIPGHGLGYGALRYLGADEQRSALSKRPSRRSPSTISASSTAAPARRHCSLWRPETRVRREAHPARCDAGSVSTARCATASCGCRSDFGRKRYRRDDDRALAAFTRRAAGAGRPLHQRRCGLTPSDVALSGAEPGRSRRLGAGLPQIEDIYPLSPMQQGMLFHALHEARGALRQSGCRSKCWRSMPQSFVAPGKRSATAMRCCEAVSSGAIFSAAAGGLSSCRCRSLWMTGAATLRVRQQRTGRCAGRVSRAGTG